MHEDARYWLSVVDQVHPAPFKNASREEIAAGLTSAIEQLPDATDPLHFWAVLSGAASLMRDSHSYIHHPNISRGYDEALFRYRVELKGGELFWRSRNSSVNIPQTARITSINGVEASTISSWLLGVGVGELDAEIARDAAKQTAAVLWTRDVYAPFMITWLDEKSHKRETTAAGLRGSDVHSSATDERVTLASRETEDGIAILTLTSMPDPEEFFPVFKKTFERVAEVNPSALIIDIRNNGGGTTEAADMILGVTTDQHFRLVGKKHWKVSELYKAVVREAYGGAVPEYESAKAGTILTFEYEESPPLDYGYRYQGPVCFLIGPNTASAAMMMANAIEDYDLAVLIGEPTGSPPNYFGEVYEFELPESGLRAQSSVAYFVRANGDEFNQLPVLPDIRVSSEDPATEESNDRVMVRALAWARSLSSGHEITPATAAE